MWVCGWLCSSSSGGLEFFMVVVMCMFVLILMSLWVKFGNRFEVVILFFCMLFFLWLVWWFCW